MSNLNNRIIEFEQNLSQTQVRLYECLKEKNEHLAEMYHGALQILYQSSNPIRLKLAAHAIREMMKKLPIAFDVPVEIPKQGLGDLANTLENKWNAMIAKSKWPGSPEWSGEIDNDLKKILNEMRKLVEKNSKIKKAHKENAQGFIRKQNLHKDFLPNNIEKLKVNEWQEYKKLFDGVAHEKHISESEFLEKLNGFEYFLLNYIEPSPFESKKKIAGHYNKGGDKWSRIK